MRRQPLASGLPALLLSLAACAGPRYSGLYREARGLYQAGSLTEASAAFDRAIASARAERDAATWAQSLSDLGWLRAEEGRLPEASRLMRESVEVCRQAGIPESVHLARLAALQARSGSYDAGLLTAQEALDAVAARRRALKPALARSPAAEVLDDVMEKPGLPPDVGAIKAVTAAEGAQTTILYLRGDFARARETGSRALEHFADIAGLIKLANGDERRSYHEGYGLTMLAVADSELRLGRFREGRGLMAQARRHFAKAHYAFGDLVAEGLLAFSYALEGDYAEACRLAAPAFQRIQAAGMDEIIWRMRYEFAAIVAKEARGLDARIAELEKLDRAEDLLAFQSAAMRQRGLKGLHLLQLLPPERAAELDATMDRLGAIRDKAQAVAEARRLSAQLKAIAWESSLQAVESVESLRGLMETDLNKRVFLGDKRRVYELAVLLALESKGPQEALVMAERSRSRGLADLFAGQELRAQSPQLAAREQELRRALQADYARAARLREAWGRRGALESPQASRALAEVGADIAKAEAAYRDILVTARREIPETLSLTCPEPLDFKTLAEAIPQDAGLLAYFVTDEETILWTKDQAGLKALRLAIARRELSGLIQKYRDAVLARAPGEPALAQELHRLLVAPAALAPGRVLVLAHDSLHYLPFAALHDGAKRLAEEHALRGASSLTVLHTLSRRNYPASVALVAVGNPDLGDPRYDLPNAEAEARDVAALYPAAQVLLRGQAQKDILLPLAAKADLLHLACHAQFDAREPMLSGLYLSAKTPEAGLWSAADMTAAPLRARLAVLSACRTGLGQLGAGDEVVGLNRALLYAGVGTVVSSLWSVEDKSTARLMRAFHEGLRAGQAPSAALSAAQTDLLHRPETAQPFYWAAFGANGLDL